LFPDTAEVLGKLKSAGFLLFVVSNQSGVGRGLFSSSEVAAVNVELNIRIGYLIDEFQFCPHLPTDDCRCRKPKTEMFERIAARYKIDFRKSWMVGDKAIDIEAGKNAGLKTIHVMTGYGESEAHLANADYIAKNLTETGKIILDKH
ncbi:MAG TPA: HAD-IIIA family hydrolase, partial [Pyrinomonadaceae bacterium]|nr:HAD-IIIA family hydrolase [Pyrinomonadaceae bacterium]